MAFSDINIIMAIAHGMKSTFEAKNPEMFPCRLIGAEQDGHVTWADALEFWDDTFAPQPTQTDIETWWSELQAEEIAEQIIKNNAKNELKESYDNGQSINDFPFWNGARIRIRQIANDGQVFTIAGAISQFDTDLSSKPSLRNNAYTFVERLTGLDRVNAGSFTDDEGRLWLQQLLLFINFAADEARQNYMYRYT